jgi:N-acyl-D-aspartate/D-glutamate deacylase
MMFDILIKQATIVDGTGAAGWRGDVGIHSGHFQAVELRLDAPAQRIIDAQDLVLAPGFIDMHSHSDKALLDDPRAEVKLRQGVTAEVVGNCGASLAPVEPDSRDLVVKDVISNPDQAGKPISWLSFGEYAAALEASGLSINVLGLVGHGTLRTTVMGFSPAAPDARQLEHMKNLLADALSDGACGLSTGLIYAPGCFAETRELIELAKVAGRFGKIYTSHMRNEAEGIFDALGETIRIGQEAGVPVHVSHLKLAGYRNWHLAEEVVETIETARRQGVDITCDVYPYFRSQTTMLALLPPWSLEGGVPALLSRLQSSENRERIIGEMIDGLPGWENMFHNAGWDKIFVTAVKTKANKPMEGRSVSRLAPESGQDPFQFVLSLIQAEQGAVSIVSESMREDNVARFLALPYAMVGSDGSPTAGKPHPRLYGTFPRVIRRFVRELAVLSLEEAVHKMTGLTAARLGLADWGMIQLGRRANAVLFDPQSLADTATFEEPRQYPLGVHQVIVNGEVVFDKECHTGATPGKFLRT